MRRPLNVVVVISVLESGSGDSLLAPHFLSVVGGRALNLQTAGS